MKVSYVNNSYVVKVEIESKNKLAAFLKFLVAMQYNASYTFNLFFLSQSPPSSNKLQSGETMLDCISFRKKSIWEEINQKNLDLLFGFVNGLWDEIKVHIEKSNL